MNIVGQNLINVEAVEINGDRYSLENNQTNFVAERLVSPGEHSLEVQTIFKDQTSRQDQLFVLAPEKYHSGVGVADFIIGRNSVGQTEVVEEVDGRVYKTGRLAYYGQSRFNADTRAVLQVDTGVQHWDSLFDDFFKTKKGLGNHFIIIFHLPLFPPKGGIVIVIFGKNTLNLQQSN